MPILTFIPGEVQPAHFRWSAEDRGVSLPQADLNPPGMRPTSSPVTLAQKWGAKASAQTWRNSNGSAPSVHRTWERA